MMKQTMISDSQEATNTLAAETSDLFPFSPDASEQDARSDTHSVYCLFCCVGREQVIAGEMERRGLDCMIAYVDRIVVSGGKETVEQRRMLPGYVFLETPLPLHQGVPVLQSFPDVLKLLSYGHGEYALRGADLAFYQWLKKQHGIVEVSQIYREGDRIRVASGPLKAYEANIVAVNRKRRCIAISLGEGSLMSKIWCSVEDIEHTE